MQYSEIRRKIKTGDLLAWSSEGHSWHGFKLKLVNWFTRSEYTHVGVAWVANNRVFVLEAIGNGISITPLSKVLPCYWIKLDQKIDLDYAFSKVGQKYSNWQAFLGALQKLKVGEDESWQCSEYTQRIYMANDPRWDKATPTPKGQVEFALTNYDTKLVFVEGEKK